MRGHVADGNGAAVNSMGEAVGWQVARLAFGRMGEAILLEVRFQRDTKGDRYSCTVCRFKLPTFRYLEWEDRCRL